MPTIEIANVSWTARVAAVLGVALALALAAAFVVMALGIAILALPVVAVAMAIGWWRWRKIAAELRARQETSAARPRSFEVIETDYEVIGGDETRRR